MLYTILCYDSEDVVGAWTEEEEAAVMGRLHKVLDRLAQEGRLGPVARLLPTTSATTIRKGREAMVIDGPFAETKEQLLGYYTVECDTLEQAIEIAKELGAASGTNGSYELRPVAYMRPETTP
jgi:hypothetical protein